MRGVAFIALSCVTLAACNSGGGNLSQLNMGANAVGPAADATGNANATGGSAALTEMRAFVIGRWTTIAAADCSNVTEFRADGSFVQGGRPGTWALAEADGGFVMTVDSGGRPDRVSIRRQGDGIEIRESGPWEQMRRC